MKRNRYDASLREWEGSKQALIPASSFLAKDPRLFTLGAYPIYLMKGKGAHVYDLDGNRFLDLQSAFGPTILGVSDPVVNAAMIKQLKQGTLFSLLHPLQNQLARMLQQTIPCAERVRLFKTGSDATTGAIRIARAFTGRTQIASCHFHGWDDWCYVIDTKMNRGIPARAKEEIHEFTYNDLGSLQQIFSQHPNDIAAVILEPASMDAPNPGFLEAVRDLAHAHGALLIFDEVVTGFRFLKGSAQAYFGVLPDLCCLAKAMANGASMAAVGGSKAIMEATSDVVTSTTYAEETISLAAAIATIQEVQRRSTAEHIWRIGRVFQDAYNRLAKTYGAPTTCVGFPCRLELRFLDQAGRSRLDWKTLFLQASADQGVLFGNAIFFNAAHTDAHIRRALRVTEQVFKAWNEGRIEALTPRGEQTQELW